MLFTQFMLSKFSITSITKQHCNKMVSCSKMSSFRDQKRLAHAQVGLLLEFFKISHEHSRPLHMWVPWVKNIHIAWHCATSLGAWHVTKKSKNPDREAALVAIFSHLTSGTELPFDLWLRGFPFNLWDRVNSSSTSLHLLGRSLVTVSKLDSPPR